MNSHGPGKRSLPGRLVKAQLVVCCSPVLAAAGYLPRQDNWYGKPSGATRYWLRQEHCCDKPCTVVSLCHCSSEPASEALWALPGVRGRPLCRRRRPVASGAGARGIGFFPRL